MGWLLLFTAAAHMFYTPFTKVEESFNIQATHDIIYLKQNFSQYDHHEFPGVVPRTFVGPLVLSVLSSPIILFLEFFDFPKFYSQYVVRFILSTLVALSWNSLRKTISSIFGKHVSFWFTAITLSQFHFIFYMSRTLPNILVLPIVLLALTAWLKQENEKFIWLSGISILVFRSELLLLFGLLLFYNVFYKQIQFKSFLQTTIIAGFMILLLTICIDTFFWKKLIWPEGKVLWYNTILNKSSNWGTSPFLWYFYSAIPRAMGFSAFLIPFGLYSERRIRAICVCSLIFVFLYSFLPHKELRFIIYVFPIFNISSACYCSAVWRNYQKSAFNKLKAVGCVGHIFLNFCLTLFLLLVSSTNYPGGEAILKLHSIDNSPNQSVHISNLVAQTGFTRFYQSKDWTYNKTEHLKYNEDTILSFDYLLVEQNSKTPDEIETLKKYFIQIDQVDCFNRISVQYKYYNPINIETKPCVTIMKRNDTKVKREPDYEGLRKLALENKKEFRNSKVMWKIVEEYYNSRKLKMKAKKNVNVKATEKQEEVKILIDKISKLDVTDYCDLDKVDIKECLKTVIDIVEE